MRDPALAQTRAWLPKGVVHSHVALLHYLRVSCDALAMTPDDVTVGWPYKGGTVIGPPLGSR